MIWILGAAAWWTVGIFSHVWWWTKKHDYYSVDIFMSVFSGTLGPLNWLIGWVVCGDNRGEGSILLKQRTRHPQDHGSSHE